MALTRAQLLAGNSSQGVVLPGQVQAVSAGAGVSIATNGQISVDATTVQGLVKLNNPGAFNAYVWPGTDGATGEFLQTDGTGVLSWASPTGYAVVTVQPQPAPVPADVGELWFDCSTGTLNVYQNCVGGPSWFNVAEPGLPVLPGSTNAVPAFAGGAGTQANPYLCSATTVSAGSSVFVVNTVTVTGLAPFQYVPIVDLNAVTNGGRFAFSNYYANAAGSLTFQVIFRDRPASTPGTTYIAEIRVGYASAYIRANVAMVAPLSTTAGSIAGTPQAGSTLTYTTGVASGGSGGYSYAWVWKNDLGATLQTNGGTYVIPGAQIGRSISVTLTATDSSLTTATATTAPTAVVTGSPFPSLVWNPTPSNGMNNIPGGQSGTYSGTATSITTTGCVEASVAGGAYSTGTQSITSGQTLAIRWASTVGCGGAPSGTPLSGTLTDGTYTNAYSIVVNRVPVPSIADISDSAIALNAVSTKAIATPIAGLNTTAYVTYVGTSTGSNIQVATAAAGPYTTLATSGTGFPVTNSQTLYIRQTVGGTISTGYTAIIRVGDGTNAAGTFDEFTYTATTVATATFPNSPFTPVGGPNASPAATSEPAPFMPVAIEGTATATWGDGSVTLTGTNMVLNVGAGAFAASQAVVDTNVVGAAWLPSYITGLTNGATATGSFTDGTYTNSYTFIVDKQPAWTVPALVTGAALSTQVSTGVLTPNNFNCPVTVSFAAPGGTDQPMTAVEVSINGGAVVPITLGTTTVTLNPGDTFELFGDTGAANSQVYGVSVTLGAAAAQVWRVTTTAVTPSIQTPSITAPVNGATGLNPAVNSPAGITITGDTYTPLNGASATQTSSTWEVYKAIAANPTTSAITNVNTAATIYPSTISSTGLNSTGVFGNIANLASAAYGNGRYVISQSQAAFGFPNYVAYSTSGTGSWTLGAALAPAGQSISDLIFDGTRFMALTSDGKIHTSLDGITWNPPVTVAAGFTTGGNGLSYNGSSTHLAVGNSGAIYYSTNNGSSWTAATSGTASALYASGYGNGFFVAVGANGTILRSPDGIVWSSATSPSSNILFGVAWSGSKWYASGQNGVILTSSDALTWTEPTYPASANSRGAALVLNSTSVAIGGFNNTVVTYNGGTTWSSAVGGLWYGRFGVGPNGAVVGGGNGDSERFVLTGTELTLTDATDLASMSPGDSVVEIGGGGDASGTIAYVDTSGNKIGLATTTGTWDVGSTVRDTTAAPVTPPAPPNTGTPDPLKYTAITGSPLSGTVQVGAADPSVLVPQSSLAVSSTYYARVQYATTAAAPATSNFSNWSSFATASAFLPAPGSAFGGGFFGGQINDGGIIYNLIVGPVASAQSSTTLAWKNASTAESAANTAAAQNVAYGFPMSQIGFNGGAATYPALHFARSVSTGGFNDWYLPAKNELEILYRNLKPTTTLNNTSAGANPNAVPSPTGNYTSGNPLQTTAANFQDPGGTEAFPALAAFWTSTETSGDPTRAWTTFVDNGQLGQPFKTGITDVRAIRREYANAPVAIGAAFGGGFFAGQYVDPSDGLTYNLIVAPVATGQFGGATPSGIQWKTTTAADTNPNSQNTVYGKLASDQFNDPAHPAFQWARGLTIATLSDWYIPAKGEMAILVYNLGPNWTTATDFKAGTGAQAFDSTVSSYWSSTEISTDTTAAWGQSFGNGSGGDASKVTTSYFARAVRRQLA